MIESRIYMIGGLPFEVSLERPWTFKELTEEQKVLVARLKAGEDVGVIPIPADKVSELGVNEKAMGKEAMTRELWETLSEEERSAFRHSLDFLQYAPFEVSGDSLSRAHISHLTVHASFPEGLDNEIKGAKRVVAVDEMPPIYYGYRSGDKTIYEFFPAEGVSAGVFVMSDDSATGDYYPRERMGARITGMQVNTSLMILYTFAGSKEGALLLHASMPRHNGRANLFFGVSGTGKSTHSRLWLENVPGVDIMNDDNPIVRFEDGVAVAYGSPWSGKTLCYRNVKAPVRAMVRLEQRPENHIERLSGLQAYASIIAAVSTIRWDSSVMSRIIPLVERVAMEVPCWHLGCRPDREAVEVCKAAIEGND